MTLTIDQTASTLAREVNDAIAAACAGQSMLSWMTIAEREAGLRVDPDLWETMWSVPVGQPPRIAITQYKVN